MTFKKISEKTTSTPEQKATLFQHDIGLRHLHIEHEGPEQSFVIAFPTFPSDSKGTPHILEHFVLHGSELYPQRTPFFSMLNRSVAQFMNAFTGMDYTMYPFTTTENKDFENLLSVYLDATLYPLLRETEFLQEGWRPSFNENGEFEFQGVVYNEMKGAFANPQNVLYYSLLKSMYPNTPYANHSGGDPLEITKLSLNELKQYHEYWYHPSKAVVITYGDTKNLKIDEIQKTLEKFLSRHKDYGKKMEPLVLPDYKNLSPYQKEVEFTVPGDSDSRNTYMNAYRLKEKFTLLDHIIPHVLQQTVFSQTGAWDKFFLDYPENPSFNFISTENAMPFIVLGVEGKEKSSSYELLNKAIEHIKNNPIDAETLRIAYEEIKLTTLESEPQQGMHAGLRLIQNLANLFIINESVFEHLSFYEALVKHEKELLDPSTYINWMEKNIFNPKEKPIQISSLADIDFHFKRNQEEAERKEAIASEITETDKNIILINNKELEKRQKETQDLSGLPMFHLKDLEGRKNSLKEHEFHGYESSAVFHFPYIHSNETLHEIQLTFDLSGYSLNELKTIYMTMQYLGAAGIADMSWEESQMFLREKAPHLSSEMMTVPYQGDTTQARILFNIQARNFPETITDIGQTIAYLVENASFNDENYVHQTALAQYEELKQSMKSIVPKLVSAHHEQKQGPLSQFIDEIKNTGHFRQVKEFAEKTPQEKIEMLKEGHRLILKAPRYVLTKGDQKTLQAGLDVLKKIGVPYQQIQDPCIKPVLSNIKETTPYTIISDNTSTSQAILTWNHNITSRDDEFASLTVLKHYIDQVYLHPLIREQGGAYGAYGSSKNSNFRIESYRDPTPYESMNTIKNMFHTLIKDGIREQAFEEAKLKAYKGTIQNITPKQQYDHAEELFWSGTTELNTKFRNNLLNVSKENLVSLVEKHFTKEPDYVTLFLSEKQTQEALNKADYFKVIQARELLEKPKMKNRYGYLEKK